MTEHQSSPMATDEQTFTWHPEYKGRSVEDVRRKLADELAQDQRAYELALSSAETSEHEALASVMELEKRWSDYSFGWAEIPPDELATRIVDFELERDRRQEMILYDQYRAEATSVVAHSPGGDWRSSLSDDQRRKVANIGAVVAMVLIVLVIAMVVIAVL